MKTSMLILTVLFATLASSGCVGADCDTENAAGGQRVVCTTSRTFSYTRNGSMISEKKDYTWENKESTAAVSTAFNGATSGSATVTVKDAAGKTVYSKSHGHTGQSADDEPTTEGTPGRWTISINIGALTGQVAINVRAT
jgi:hypothetical protein